jgi:hypothetical protein
MSQSTLAIVLAKGDHHEHAIKHTAEDLWFLPAVHKHQKQECHLFILIQPTKPTWQSSYIGHTCIKLDCMCTCRWTVHWRSLNWQNKVLHYMKCSQHQHEPLLQAIAVCRFLGKLVTGSAGLFALPGHARSAAHP